MLFAVANSHKLDKPTSGRRLTFGLSQPHGLRNSLLVLLLVNLAIILALYQTRPGFEIKLGQPNDDAYIASFYEPENNAQGSYRWSKATSTANLPLTGSPFVIEVAATVVRPATITEPVRVSLDWNTPNLSQIFEIPPDQAHSGQERTFQLRGGTRPQIGGSTGQLAINSTTFQPSKSDNRALGLAVKRIFIQAQPNKLGLVVPPLSLWLVWGFGLLCLQACLGVFLQRQTVIRAGRSALFWGLALSLPGLLAGLFLLFTPLFVLNGLFWGGYALLPGLALFLWLWRRERAVEWWAAELATVTLATLYNLVTFPALLLTALVILGLCLYANPRFEADRLNRVWVGTLAILSGWGMLQASFFVTNDAERHHFYWLSQLDILIRQGQLYPRWAADFAYSHGNAVFNFYAPLSRYLAEMFVLANLPPASAYHAALLGLGVVGGLGMYSLARQWLGGLGATVAAAAFLFNPYQLANLYQRGSLAEACAYYLLPWLLFWLNRLLQPDYSRIKAVTGGAAVYALIVLSHQLTGFFVLIFLVGPYLLLLAGGQIYQSWRQGGGGREVARVGLGWLWVGLAVAVGLGLAAFYLLPAVTESGAVRVSSLVRYPPEQNLLALSDAPRLTEWVAHIERVKDSDRYSTLAWIGISQIVLAVLGFVVGLWQKPRSWWPWAAAIMLAFLLMMQLSFTAPFWQNVPFMRYIEFPWRLMGLTALFSAVLIGRLAESSLRLEMRSRVVGPLFGVALMGLLIFTGSGDVVLRPSFDGRYSPAQIAAQFGDAYYLPTYITPDGLDTLQNKPLDYVRPYLEGNATPVQMERTAPTSYRITTSPTSPAQLVIPVFYFPGWQLTDATGQTLAISPNSPYGFITANVKAGPQTLTLKFEDTLPRTLGVVITLATFVLVIVALLLARRRNKMIKTASQS